MQVTSRRHAWAAGAAGFAVLGTTVALVAAPPVSAVPTQAPVRETGTVVDILDGDTFLFKDDATGNTVRVRLLGVNTPEVPGRDSIHFTRFFCGAEDAEALLASLMPEGSKVQLRAENAASTGLNNRPQRYAYAQNPATGEFDVDVQEALAKAGLAMWFTVDHEASNSQPYRLLVDQAMREGKGIWNPSNCVGDRANLTSNETIQPIAQPNAQIKMTVHWDAPGNDGQNPNGEFAIIRNTGSVPVDLSGWTFRDSSREAWYVFPAGTVLAPGAFFEMHSGRTPAGGAAPGTFYMGDQMASNPDMAIFPNPEAGKFLGDSIYLMDTSTPTSNTSPRWWFVYPCAEDCVSDPAKGKLLITKVNPKSDPRKPNPVRANQEYIVVTNKGTTPILLDDYYLRRKVSTFNFVTGTVLQPGKSITVRIGKGTPNATTQYWGMSAPLLNDASDKVELLSMTNVPISKKQW